jgi:glycosyltransferase involved in cell wall biosynthesis
MESLNTEASARTAALGRTRTTVALVVSNLEYGGAERQVVELANRLHGDDFEVHVIALSSYVPLAARLEAGKATLHIVPRKSKYGVGAVLQLARLLRALRAGVVHGFLFDAEIAARLAGKLARVPVIVGSERNADYAMPARKRILYSATAFAMDVCVANSKAGADFNRRLFGHSPSKYRVVYNGVDTARFRPRDRDAIRVRLGIPQAAFCAGVFGSFKPQKNHPLFFKAAAQLVERSPDAFFLIAGDSLESGRRGSIAYKATLMKLVRELALEGRCRFLGNRDDVEELYCACDVTVLPSLHEGTPNVALESMASGVPVIATDVSDNRDVIPHGEAGFIVPPDDVTALTSRLLELRHDPGKRSAMGRFARRWVEERFSLARLAHNTAEVYREIIALKRSSAVQVSRERRPVER